MFGQLPRCFAGTSLLPLCLFLRPILKFWSIGVTLMRFAWANQSERRILVSNFSVTCNSFREFHTLDWFPYVRSSSAKSMKTSAAPCPEIHNPIVVYPMICTQQVRDSTHDGCHALQRDAMFYHADHTSSTWLLHFCHHSFWTFY